MEQYAVFVMDESRSSEFQVAEYRCYAEARRLRRELSQAGKDCVIRSTGETGGSE